MTVPFRMLRSCIMAGSLVLGVDWPTLYRVPRVLHPIVLFVLIVKLSMIEVCCALRQLRLIIKIVSSCAGRVLRLCLFSSFLRWNVTWLWPGLVSIVIALLLQFLFGSSRATRVLQFCVRARSHMSLPLFTLFTITFLAILIIKASWCLIFCTQSTGNIARMCNIWLSILSTLCSAWMLRRYIWLDLDLRLHATVVGAVRSPCF